jgi:glutamine synthetase
MQALRETLSSQGVHTLIAQFTDLHGVAKGKWLPLDQLDTLLSTGAGFSGPSIEGTGLPRMGPRSEYYGRGDASTARSLPWMPGFARLACDGFVDGRPFDACPRQVLKRQLARLAERGWSLQTGIEPEFFLLRRTEQGWQPADAHDRLDKPSYDLKSLQRQASLLTTLSEHLRQCGLQVFQIDHEDAQGQYELNFRHDDALASADHLMLFKMAAQSLAEARGLVFSMMPKPFANQPGSGMHFHVSLWQGGGNAARNLFVAPDVQSLSRLGEHFMAGVLAHSSALCALAAPTVNSYKRLGVSETLSGTSWAPALVAHGPNNRTALVRTLADRLEWRLPDASANPYLVTAGLIAAGLDGVDRELEPAAACTDDLFTLTSAQAQARGLQALPSNLGEATRALAADQVLLEALGAGLATQFLDLKAREWSAFQGHVSDWELQHYATRF